MKTTKKMMLFKGLAVLLVCTLLTGVANPTVSEAKAVSKITKTITLKEGMVTYHIMDIKADTEVKVKVKFLNVSGSLKGKEFGGHDEMYYQKGKMVDGGMNPLWATYQKNLNKNSIKAGKELSATGITVKKNYTGMMVMNWGVPKGIKKVKMKVTYYTTKGNSGIASFKSNTRKEG